MTNHIDGIAGAAGVVHDHINGVSTYRDKASHVLAVLPLLPDCRECDHQNGIGPCFGDLSASEEA